jgi:aspartyl-tRNA(Asn)/glutamyl-tRNA(Gln) amidotransferase subunit A
MLDNFVAPYDATFVERLQNAGAVHARQDEHGRVRDGLVERDELLRARPNPWDHALVPGGSSGGSAPRSPRGSQRRRRARTPAARFASPPRCPASRHQADLRRVSRYGMIAFASSLDQAGVLTQTAEDAALLLEAMAGFDERDSTSLDEPVPRYSRSSTSRGSA